MRTKEFINHYRLFPRLFVLLFAYLLWQATEWFMNLKVPSAEQAAFVSTIIATAAAFFKFYLGSGPNANTKTTEDE